jgi:hypothetical protein
VAGGSIGDAFQPQQASFTAVSLQPQLDPSAALIALLSALGYDDARLDMMAGG